MRIPLLTALALLCASTIAAQPALPNGATAVDSMVARVGTTIDPSEKAYFGLFPGVELANFTQATLDPVEGGELVVTIQTAQGSEEKRLSQDVAQTMSRYVAQYEAIRTPNPTPLALRIHREMIVSGLGRHAFEPFEGRPIEVETRAGRRAQGWIVYADDDRLVLYPADRPFDVRKLGENALVFASADLARVQSQSRVPRGLSAPFEVGASLAIQAAGAFLAYQGNADQGDAAIGAGIVLTSALTATTLGLVDAAARRGTSGRGSRQSQNASTTAPFAERAFFAERTPSELDTWLASLPAVPPMPDAPLVVSARRRFAHVRFDSPYRPTTSSDLTRISTASLNGRDFDVTLDRSSTTVKGRAGGEIVVSPIALLHVGAEAYWNASDSQSRPESPGSEAGQFRSEDRPEQVTTQPDWAVFGGLSFGGDGSRALQSRVEVSGGVAYRGVEVSSYFPATLATPEVSAPEEAFTFYSASQSGIYPYARLSYDFFVTPITSLSIKATLVQQPDFVIDAQSADLAFRGNSWATQQPEHTYTFSPLSLSFGLRTHL